jgi:hypothetical protein
MRAIVLTVSGVRTYDPESRRYEIDEVVVTINEDLVARWPVDYLGRESEHDDYAVSEFISRMGFLLENADRIKELLK